MHRKRSVTNPTQTGPSYDPTAAHLLPIRHVNHLFSEDTQSQPPPQLHLHATLRFSHTHGCRLPAAEWLFQPTDPNERLTTDRHPADNSQHPYHKRIDLSVPADAHRPPTLSLSHFPKVPGAPSRRQCWIRIHTGPRMQRADGRDLGRPESVRNCLHHRDGLAGWLARKPLCIARAREVVLCIHITHIPTYLPTYLPVSLLANLLAHLLHTLRELHAALACSLARSSAGSKLSNLPCPLRRTDGQTDRS
ncbi:hypothetical protein IWZ00DRAFT_52298 [Phyllosticta capitalensis]